MDRKHMAVLLTALWFVAGSAIGFTVRPAEAVQLGSLPLDTQRAVTLILSGFSPHVRHLSAEAIRVMPPERARTMVNNLQALRSYPDAQVVPLARQYDFAIQIVLRFLPPSLHQRFINGVWGVSDAEHQFAQTAERQVVQMLQAGSGPVPSKPGAIPLVDMSHPSPSERGMWCALGGGFINGAGYCQSN